MASPKSEECSTDPISKIYHRTSLTFNTKPFSSFQAQEGRPSYSVAQHPLWEWDGYSVIVPLRKQTTCCGTSHHVASHSYPSLAAVNSRIITPSSHHGFHSNVLVSPFETSSFHDRTSQGYRSYQRLESLGSRLSGLGKRAKATSNAHGLSHPIPSRAISCDSLMKSNSAVSPISQQYNCQSASCEPLFMVKNDPNHAGKSTSPCRKPLLNTNAFMRPTSAKVTMHQKWAKSPKTATSNGINEFGDTENTARYNGSNTKVFSGSPVHSNAEVKVDRSFHQTEHSYGNLKSSIKQTKSIHGDPEITFTEAVKRSSEDRIPKNNVHERCVTFSKETEGLSSQCIHLQNASHNSSGKIFRRTVPDLIKEPNFQSSFKSECIYTNGNLESLVKESSTTKENDISTTNKTPVSFSPTNLHVRNTSPVNFPGPTGLPQRPDQTSKRISFSDAKVNISSLTLQIAAMQLRSTSKIVKDPESSKNETDSQGSEVNTEGEELEDGLENASSQDYNEASECSTITDSCSTVSMEGSTKLNFNDAMPAPPHTKNAFVDYPQALECKNQVVKPALINSLFHDMPSMIYFGTPNEKIEQLPWEQRRQMKWKISTVTPIVVKNAVARSHFKITKRSYDWLGCWGHHMKSPLFKTLREYQKLNHFPGSFQIGRKDRLWRNLLKMQVRFGKREFNFFPQSFILPHDIKLLKNAWAEGSTKQKWIIKPPASARGIGIQVIHKWNQIPKKRPLLVQKYLHKPYLIGESKFDLRIYVYVTSYDPLRIYMFTDGLVRFASCKYSSSMKSLSNKFMHLTNYSVNKLNAEYKPNCDGKLCQGHKWSLKALWLYLNQKGMKTEQLREQMKDVIIKTIIASESYVNSQMNLYVRNRYTCHELFGFDIMLDENLKMWVLEVNISPSTSATGRKSRELTADEKLKRVYYLSQKSPSNDFYSSLLDILTPEDIQMLMESEDEYNRQGQFERIFPCLFSSRYLRFFEQPRYFNILLDLWEQKYGRSRQPGIRLLQELSYRKVHLGLSVDPTHVWHPPKNNLTQTIDIHGICNLNPLLESEDSRTNNNGESSIQASAKPLDIQQSS
ncbi:tubulin monoglutamylase TTLL4 isoform X2 [Narcine bancroftii]|uniref:tubulin monoglutamylase TTLL4 isoform X2 n=1 Tax=Narcine bancroftii TaxID=1343680 RepID=UPI0038321A6B